MSIVSIKVTDIFTIDFCYVIFIVYEIRLNGRRSGPKPRAISRRPEELRRIVVAIPCGRHAGQLQKTKRSALMQKRTTTTQNTWRTQPEIHPDRQQYLAQRLAIQPGIQQGI